MMNYDTVDTSDKELVARPATADDVDMVVELINAAALEDSGMIATNRKEKLIEWGLPQFRMETDTCLLLAPSGQAVGYVGLWESEPYVRHYLWGRVHPEHRGRGIGTFLMGWAEARAQRSLDKAPPGARISVHTNALHDNKGAHELFEVRGYSPDRHFFHMLREMAPNTPPPTPQWPEGITVRPYALGKDDRMVHRTLDKAFQDHWGYVEGETFEEWFHWIEEDTKFDPSVCFLATANGAEGEEIVGVLMARPEWEEDSTISWIDELGVLRGWRNKGLGLALLYQVFGEFHKRERYKVGLGVDGASLTGALRLYEKAGMRVFRQIDAYEKVLRPGNNLSTQALKE